MDVLPAMLVGDCSTEKNSTNHYPALFKECLDRMADCPMVLLPGGSRDNGSRIALLLEGALAALPHLSFDCSSTSSAPNKKSTNHPAAELLHETHRFVKRYKHRLSSALEPEGGLFGTTTTVTEKPVVLHWSLACLVGSSNFEWRDVGRQMLEHRRVEQGLDVVEGTTAASRGAKRVREDVEEDWMLTSVPYPKRQKLGKHIKPVREDLLAELKGRSGGMNELGMMSGGSAARSAAAGGSLGTTEK